MNKVDELRLYEEKARRKATNNLVSYTQYLLKDFDWQPYHKVYYKILDRFAKGEIKKLAISMPPQHGKSEGSTRRLPSYMLGLNPDLRLAITSYNSTIARKFNRDNQRIIDTPEYHKVFPNTTLNNSNVVTISDSYLRNSEEFEIVGHKGTLKAVGRGGALTSITLDCVIMDDLYKDYAEGNSPVIREAAWDWYTSVVKTRLHNDSQQLIVFTRWHEEDVIGRIEANEKVHTINDIKQLDNIGQDDWVKINFEAIKTGNPTLLDPRKEGQPLWSNRHSLKKLELERKLDPNKFECLYQGNPSNKDGLLYSSDWKTYNELPKDINKYGNYTDTADSGDDYLCSICYVVTNKGIYITDILYTLDPMEVTENSLPNMLNQNGTKTADIESNNGGRYFALNVGKKTDALVLWFHQGKNKESRILSNSAQVQEHIYFPIGWESKYPVFWKHLTGYKRLFKANKQDGAPDVLTGIIEKNYSRDFKPFKRNEDQHTRHARGDSTGADAAPWASEKPRGKGAISF